MPTQTGKVISQTSPSARQAKRVSPFSWAIICSVTRPPKPLRVGFCTAGPPVSVQRRFNRPSASCDHFRSTWPLATDKAPYLAAFVASSCRITAMVCAAFGSNKTWGPSIRTRVSPFSEYGASSCVAMVDNSAPIQRVSTNNE